MPAKKVSLDSTNEKPSLASLKPDKSKGVAAKKRAVKKIDAATASKTPTKRAKTAALKKIATKKIPAKAVKVSEPEVTLPITRTATKKVVSKTSTKKSAPVSKKTIYTSKNPLNDFSVKLPNNMSIRAREKALVLLYMIEKDFREPAKRIAYVSGFAFVIFGSFLSLSFAVLLPNDALQSANVASTTNTLTDTTTNTVSTVLRPVFTSNETLPSVITGDFAYTFKVANGKNVSARLYSFADGRKISLNLDTLYTDTYRIFIKYQDLVTGEYRLELIAESVQDGSKSYHTVGKFYVEKATRTDNSGSGSTSEDDTATTTSSNEGSSSGTSGSGSNTADTTTSNETPTNTSTTVVASTTSIVEKTGEEITEPRIRIDDDTFTNQEVVKIEAPKNTRTVEVYVRPLKSIQSRFLGSAVQGSLQWFYFFDTFQVPNGEYELFARTRSDASTVLTTDARKIKVSNTVATPAAGVTTEAASLPAPTPTSPATTPPDSGSVDTSVTTPSKEPVESTTEVSPIRSFSPVRADDLVASRSSSTTSGVLTEVDNVLLGYREELLELLKRYAVAQQSGDAMMIDIARKELMDSKARLVTDVLRDNSSNYLADDVDMVLTERFEELQKRVETFEQLRRSANEEVTDQDTDSDGISDFDEKNLYRTNPEQADTDGDGVIDGIEIMRGFDPLDSTAQAVIEYEMPQQTIALVQEETLKVNAVVPVVQTDSDGSDLPVFAEIRGKALPNSFVTLYIFSTPTIVTVRTDNDGSFVYTFEKELEDGEHEVYVAVTDNTGAIMGRSNPFRFIKEAQAFTPVNTSGADVVSTESLSEFTTMNSYNIAVGLGILAFGIILLMLGVSLREKDGIVMKKPEHDLKAT